MRFMFDLEKDPGLKNTAASLCNAVEPFLHKGNDTDLAKRIGISPSVISIARNGRGSDHVRLSLDIALRICGHIEGGPRMIAEASGETYDITGLNTEPIFKRIQKRIIEIQEQQKYSMYRIEELTGIRRHPLAKIKKGIWPSFTLPTLLTVLSAFDGDITLEIIDPEVKSKQVSRANLSKFDTPLVSMIEMIRRTCVTNIELLTLDKKSVADEADVDLIDLKGFLSDKVQFVSLSRVFDIAKACKCEIHLMVK